MLALTLAGYPIFRRITERTPDSDAAFEPDVGSAVPKPAIERPSPFASIVGGHLCQLRPVGSTIVVCPLDERSPQALCAFGLGPCTFTTL